MGRALCVSMGFPRVVVHLLLLVYNGAPNVWNEALHHARSCRCFYQVHFTGIFDALVHGGYDGGDAIVLE
jgi:hypothetical protein